MEGEDVFTELERTVVDLQAWLGCVEGGLEQLLKPFEGLLGSTAAGETS
jgi:hypothetical protein